MTETVPLRRLATIRVLPPSTNASATGWRSRRGGESAGPGSPASGRTGELSRSKARQTARRVEIRSGLFMFYQVPDGRPAWWRILTAASRVGSVDVSAVSAGLPDAPAVSPGL